VQSQLPAAALESDLNLRGVPWAQRGGGLSKGQRPTVGLAPPSPYSSAVKKPFFIPVVAAEVLSRKVFLGTSSNSN